MNMPTHIMPNPIDTVAVTGFSNSWLAMSDIQRSGQRRILCAYAHGYNIGIRDGEEQRQPGQAEAERQCGDLSNDDEIVRVREDAIGAVGDKRRAGKNDNARRPAPTERRQNPDSQNLQGEKNGEPTRTDRSPPTENP